MNINNCKINVLGTEYTIHEFTRAQDKSLNDCDGYCDKTSKKIVVCAKDDDCDLENFKIYQKKTLRHEIIHAFHFESGIDNNFINQQYGFSETIVDWIAIQAPKFLKIFEELGIL